METTTLIFLIVMVVIVVPLGLMLFADSRGMFDEIGGGAFSVEQFKPSSTPAATTASAQEREEEIRQLVQGRNNRRVGRGEPPLDVEAEVTRLLALDPTVDPDRPANPDAELREEVRQLLTARNQRRVAKGEDPLDVETEIDRKLKDAGAL